jgi:hypothetical protein
LHKEEEKTNLIVFTRIRATCKQHTHGMQMVCCQHQNSNPVV